MISMFHDLRGNQTKVIVGLAISVAVFSFAGCKQGSRRSSIEVKSSKTIVYSREDLIDLRGYCVSQGESLEECKGEEGEWVSRFSTAFQSDPTCSGLHLIVDSGVETSRSASQELENVKGAGYWHLLVDPVYPTSEHGSRAWFYLYLEPGHDSHTTAKGTPATIVRTVCSVANGAGGKVTE